MGLGSGVSYIFDPIRGHRRRVMIKDQIVHLRHVSRRQIKLGFQDLFNRTKGMTANLLFSIRGEGPVDSDVLNARVRSKLGRYVSHPHAIEVRVENGTVILKGLILKTELERAIRAVSLVHGVQKVENQLEEHDSSENIPALQGGRWRSGEHLDLFQSNWAPSTRLLLGFLGGSLAIYGLQQRNRFGLLNGAFGFLLALRGVTNRDLSDYWNIGPIEDLGRLTQDDSWKEAI